MSIMEMRAKVTLALVVMKETAASFVAFRSISVDPTKDQQWWHDWRIMHEHSSKVRLHDLAKKFYKFVDHRFRCKTWSAKL
jgi:hypothetical protein